MKYIDPFVVINIFMILSGMTYYVLAVQKKGVRIPSSKFLGVLILVLAAIITGFIVRAIYKVDVLSTIMLFVPPLFYTYMYSKIHDNPPPYFGLHFLPGMLFLLFYLTVSIGFNAYEDSWSPYYHGLVIAANFSYAIASIKLYYDARKINFNRRILLFIQPVIIITTVLLVILVIMIIWKSPFTHDYILTYYVTLIVSFTSHFFISDLRSMLLKPEKYQKSTLTEKTKRELAQKILTQMEADKYYLNRLAASLILQKK